jgi:hypothetical protein
LTLASASNTLSCLLEMLHSKQLRSIKMLVDSNHGIYREKIVLRRFILAAIDAVDGSSTGT